MNVTETPRRLQPLVLLAIFLTAATIPALDYAIGPGEATLLARHDIHNGIVAQTARAPDRYRWLAAAIVEPPTRLLARSMPHADAYYLVSIGFYIAAFTALLWSLFAYMRLWFSDAQALAGVLIVACTIRITLRQHDYAPYSYLEPSLFALGLLAMFHRRYVVLWGIVALAALNRETGIFLVALYVATTSTWSRTTLLRAALYVATWAAIFVGVRMAGGEADRYWSVGRVLQTNLSQPLLAAFNIALFLGVFWWFALRGWRAAPVFVRRSALIVPAYVGTAAVWGLWWEVRLLMPLYPILLPLGLSYLFAPAPGRGESDR